MADSRPKSGPWERKTPSDSISLGRAERVLFSMDPDYHSISREDEVRNTTSTLRMIEKDIISQRMATEKKVVVFMCGLPARGKSFISKKLTRYLRWMGYYTQVFNVGNLRRMRKETSGDTADFFDPNNAQAKMTRERLAMDVLDVALEWLRHDGGQVAIHDATNSTVVRRRAVYQRAKQEKDVQVIFVESICNDPQVIEQNLKLKLKSPDYINVNPDDARRDFAERLRNYESAYETLTDEEGDYSYIKVIDVGKKIVACNISSYLPGQICTFLMNMHLEKRPIWLTRHGQSVYNMESRIGGDSELSPLGRHYSKAFSAFMQEQLLSSRRLSSMTSSPSTDETKRFLHAHIGEVDPLVASPMPSLPTLVTASTDTPPRGSIFGREETERLPEEEKRRFRRDSIVREVPIISEFTPAGSPKLREHDEQVIVWTSTLKRAVQTTSYLSSSYNFHQSALLNEIYAGRCEGMTYGQVMNELPLEFLARARDKLRYRYPGSGESYIDVVERVRPLITEFERVKSPIIIVGHMASLRAIYSYFMDIPLEDVPYLSFPLHTAVCLTEMPYGMEEKVFQWVEQDDEEGYVWEYLPNYSVKTDRSDAQELCTSVSYLGEEYQSISDSEFKQLRETMKQMRIDEQEEKEREYQMRMQFQYARSTQRQCSWEGCGMEFESHPLFVSHVISTHCSRGPVSATDDAGECGV